MLGFLDPSNANGSIPKEESQREFTLFDTNLPTSTSGRKISPARSKEYKFTLFSQQANPLWFEGLFVLLEHCSAPLTNDTCAYVSHKPYKKTIDLALYRAPLGLAQRALNNFSSGSHSNHALVTYLERDPKNSIWTVGVFRTTYPTQIHVNKTIIIRVHRNTRHNQQML